MDEATLFKFGKWVDYGMFHPNGKKIRAWSRSRDHFWYEAALFKFRKCIDYGECHDKGLKNSPWNGCGVGHVTGVF